MHELDDSTIRRFVLGDLEHETRCAIETEALESEELFDMIESVEDEIIEELIAGTLPSSERKLFEESLDRTPGRRHRVELVKALAARTAATSDESNVARMKERLRFANHARLAIAAGFGAAAISAVAFFAAKKGSSAPAPEPPIASVATSPAPAVVVPVDLSANTSSALSTQHPGLEPVRPRSTKAVTLPASQVVTFLLSASATRGEGESPTLVVGRDDTNVDIQIAIDDDEFSHYNVDLRASNGVTVASKTNIPVTALRGAPVIRMNVPASSLETGRHELVLAGIHERGTEEVAYIEFDVTKR